MEGKSDRGRIEERGRLVRGTLYCILQGKYHGS